MTDLHKAAKQALEALEIWEKMQPNTTACAVRIPAIQALRQALTKEKPWVKTYCAGKPNYCTPVDAVNMTQERVDETDKFNHITVVCHKDHIVGYEDYRGQCLLCVVEDLMREVGRLTAVCKEKEWVGLTDYEIESELTKEFGQWWSRHVSVCRAIEAKLKEKNASA